MAVAGVAGGGRVRARALGGALAAAMALGGGGCRVLAGIGDIACSPGCSIDGGDRIECSPDGVAVRVSCGPSSHCSAGQCVSCTPRCEGGWAVACGPDGATKAPEACGEGRFCNEGACVQCAGPDDCLSPPDACAERHCEAGACVAVPAEGLPGPGTRVADASPGNCASLVCGDDAAFHAAVDRDDAPPDDGNECTTEACSDAGAPLRAFSAPGASCRGGAGRCDGAGLCRGPLSIASNYRHTCAILSDRSVWCWGNNGVGQLGEGTTVDRPEPHPVALPAPALTVAVGENHTCAVLASVGQGAREVYCWGSHAFGQLGPGLAIDGVAHPTPVRMPLPPGVAFFALAAGARHTCAIADGGQVYCWGDNREGQLGTGYGGSWSIEPATVSTLHWKKNDPALSIDATDRLTCAVAASGAIYCWGSNEWGQITGEPGEGPYGKPCLCPHEEHGVPDSCGTLLEGTEIVDYGACNRAFVAYPVLGGSGAVAENSIGVVDVGFSHVCSANTSQLSLCWGANVWGQLGHPPYGDETSVPASSPVYGPAAITVDPNPPPGPLPPDIRAVSVVAAAGGHVCAVFEERVYCWGRNGAGQAFPADGAQPPECLREGHEAICPPTLGPVALPASPSQVAVGETHTCALLQSGDVYCWGANDAGQRGDGSVTPPASGVLAPPTLVRWPAP